MPRSVADAITRIRNAQKVKLLSVEVCRSNFKKALLSVLAEEGYIEGHNPTSSGGLQVLLKYAPDGTGCIREIAAVSLPGRRVYTKIDDLPPHRSGMGIYVLSTPKGVMSDRQARKLKVGGEVLCKVF